MTPMSSLERLSEQASAAPGIRSSHVLLAPREAPSLRESSPHMMDLARFRALFGETPRRMDMLEALEIRLNELLRAGVIPICLLIGGGFVRLEREPGDLDALVVYRLSDQTAPQAISRLLKERKPDLDLRYLPGDCGPQLLIKMTCFFHTLYQSRDKSTDQPSFLINLESSR